MIDRSRCSHCGQESCQIDFIFSWIARDDHQQQAGLDQRVEEMISKSVSPGHCCALLCLCLLDAYLRLTLRMRVNRDYSIGIIRCVDDVPRLNERPIIRNTFFPSRMHFLLMIRCFLLSSTIDCRRRVRVKHSPRRIERVSINYRRMVDTFSLMIGVQPTKVIDSLSRCVA